MLTLTGSPTGFSINCLSCATFYLEYCHLDNKSTTVLFLPNTFTYCKSTSVRAAVYHILRAQAPKKRSLALPAFSGVIVIFGQYSGTGPETGKQTQCHDNIDLFQVHNVQVCKPSHYGEVVHKIFSTTPQTHHTCVKF